MQIWSSIASIDRLFVNQTGRSPTQTSTASLCIIGPPGSGKTTVALSYAAAHARRTSRTDDGDASSRTIYISTELAFAWARDMWSEIADSPSEVSPNQLDVCTLVSYDISSSSLNNRQQGRFSDYLSQPNSDARVAYLDLRSRSQDDWDFINRVVALLSDSRPRQSPHMLVVDVMDGLENWRSSESFPESKSKRNRLVQLLRNAAGVCHLVLVAEEDPSQGWRPEEFVCDIVLRLSSSGERRSPSVEVIKARGQRHIRGPQPFDPFPRVNSGDDLPKRAVKGRKIFIGHGRSSDWRDLKDFVSDRLHLEWVEFNREPPAGISTTERLDAMLEEAGFALLVLAAEDEHSDGKKHARENVIHELGLFQGRLGFRRAIVLLEEGCAEFSNIFGLTHIRYPKGNLRAASEEIRRVLEREGLLGA